MWKKGIIFIAFMTVSTQANAFIDIEYYTHGSFQQTVDAFKRAALFFSFSSSPFQVLAYSAFGSGLLASLLMSAYSSTSNSLSGQSGSKVHVFLYTSVLGAGIVSATLTPKNTVHVFDESFNKYESVGNVPSLIVMSAGIANYVTETYREMLSISTAYPFGELTNGSPFELLRAATNNPSTFYSNYLLHSMGNYYEDCAPMANALGNVNIDTIRSDTSDLLGELEKMKHNSVFTTYYSSSVPNGESITCTAAYDKLSVLLNTPSTFEKHLSHMCAQLNLDSSNALDAVTCQGIIESTFQTAYDVAGTSYQEALQNVFSAAAIERALDTGNIEDVVSIQANRSETAEALGVWTVAMEYMPTIKGTLFVLILASSPLLILACMTPLMPTALKTYFALFLFYMIWEILDTSVVYIFEDQLNAVMKELQDGQMGLISMWSSPTASMKALNLLGQQRSAAVTLATFITVALFRVSAHALAGVVDKSGNNIEKTGEQLGKDYNLQENAGHRMTEMATGNASLSTLRSTGGHNGYVEGASANTTANIRSGQLLAQNDSVELAAKGSAYHQMEAGSTADNLSGEFGGLQNTANQLGQASATRQTASANAVNSNPNAKENLMANESHHMGQGQGYRDVADKMGVEPHDIGRYQSSTDSAKAMAEKQQLEGNNINPLDAHSTHGVMDAGRLSGGVQYENGDPTKAFDTSKQTAYNEHVQQGERAKAIDKVSTSSEEYFQGTETKTASDDMAHVDMRDQLGKTFNASPVDVARMLSGDQRLNLTPEQVEAGRENGLITDSAYKAGMKNGGLALDANMLVKEDGLAANKTTALTGNSLHSDNSTHIDSGHTVTDAVTAEQGINASNAYATMQDPNMLKVFGDRAARGLTDAEDRQQSITKAMVRVASQGTEGAITQEKGNNSLDSKSGIATAGWSTPGAVSALLGAEAGIELRYDKTNQDTRSNEIDTFRSQYLHPANEKIWDRVDNEITDGKISEQDRENQFYKYAAAHNQYLADVIDGKEENPLVQNGAVPWQKSTMALYHGWEEQKFGDTSYVAPPESNTPNSDTPPPAPKTTYYNYNAAPIPSMYGSNAQGYGNYVNNTNPKPEGEKTEPAIPQGNYGYGTRAIPNEKS